MRIRLYAIISFVFLSASINISLSQVFQPDEWCNNFPDIPGTGPIYGHASCVLGDTIYVAGGSTAGAPSTIFYKYSISGNVWTLSNTIPGSKAGGDIVKCGGKIYYIGGGSSAMAIGTPEQYVYTPGTGSWTTIANIPTPVTGNVAESYRDSLIYCMMGGWNSYETLIQVYNINTNTWSQATQIPATNGRRTFAGAIMGNRLFVCAGWGSNGVRNDFWVGTINPANPLQITWVQRTNIAVPTSRPGGTAMLGRFYVVMGEVGSGFANDSIAIWDTTTSAWTYRDGKPVRTSNLYGSVSSSITYCQGRPGVKIWVLGGSIQGQTTRPLDVYGDTCLLNCSQGITGIGNNQLPVQYKLYQNYPNPFNPVTKISYQIPTAGFVSITITDALGKEVASLVNADKQAGIYEVAFDGTNYSSGIYFYRITAGDPGSEIGFTETKKMVLIK